MVRGYDVIFQNKFLAALFITAVSILFVGGIVLGSLRAARSMQQDSEARRKFRETQTATAEDIE
jgi:hypothetical protein